MTHVSLVALKGKVRKDNRSDLGHFFSIFQELLYRESLRGAKLGMMDGWTVEMFGKCCFWNVGGIPVFPSQFFGDRFRLNYGCKNFLPKVNLRSNGYKLGLLMLRHVQFNLFHQWKTMQNRFKRTCRNPRKKPTVYTYLVGGFKYVLCSPLFGEDSHFDQYFKWVETTNQIHIVMNHEHPVW